MSNQRKKEVVTGFPKEVSDKLEYYVYRLIDPRNGETFYVGKGKGDRVFQHAQDAKIESNEEDDELSTKLKRIREIHAEGLEVITIIHRHGMKEDTAYEVESALIDAYAGLSNEVGGHGSDYGVMTPQQIIARYRAQEADLKEFLGCLIIKIKPEHVNSKNGNIYEAVRAEWKLNKSLIDNNTVPYVFASIQGVIRGVYKVDRWLLNESTGRILFEGQEATDLRHFIGNAIPAAYRRQGMASPTLYIQ